MTSQLVMSAKGRRFMKMPQTAALFAAAIPAIETAAAERATFISQDKFKMLLNTKHRPPAPVRRGRPTTLGQFGSDIIWTVTSQGVELDIHRLPYYALIQEIGTRNSADILNPRGNIAVRSQIGRRISAFLYWAPGVGANAVRPRGGGSDQLFYASELNHLGDVPQRRKVIHKEIVPKHYIQFGGRAGVLELRTGLVDEAKRVFK